jgi:inosine/xanthosine triphosphate pyrophosphatase family protein
MTALKVRSDDLAPSSLPPRGAQARFFHCYNPAIPNKHRKTWGKMSPEEQRSSSMRRIALEKLDRHFHA